MSWDTKLTVINLAITHKIAVIDLSSITITMEISNRKRIIVTSLFYNSLAELVCITRTNTESITTSLVIISMHSSTGEH